jgi:hypothetical protein
MCSWTCNRWPRRADASGAYPGFGETPGFLAAVLIMLIIAVSLYLVFKHKKWLGVHAWQTWRHKVIGHRSAPLGRVLLAFVGAALSAYWREGSPLQASAHPPRILV